MHTFGQLFDHLVSLNRDAESPRVRESVTLHSIHMLDIYSILLPIYLHQAT
jgi:hypothetical protein